jgi:hypothetical protein
MIIHMCMFFCVRVLQKTHSKYNTLLHSTDCLEQSSASSSCASEGPRALAVTGGVAVSRGVGAGNKLNRGATGGGDGDGPAGLSVRERRDALFASAATTTFSSPAPSEKQKVFWDEGAASGTFQLPKLRCVGSLSAAPE